MSLANSDNRLRLIILLVAAILAVAATAQTVINGKITDLSGLPVESAIIKLLDGSKMVGYAMSKTDGSYSVRTQCAADTLMLTVERLSFAKYSESFPNRSEKADIVLTPQSTELKEVTVKAPMVYVRGDTLTFRLDAFKGKGDISLKDAMKKIPGIEIDNSGAISYQGKQIKNFYIEGMDLLDGRYNLATENIPADYVQAVQVLNNHKDSKIDKNRYSDDVAINIKLEPWAKFKPMGTYEAAAGWGDDPLYRLGGAGMMFNKNFQTILTARISNIDEFSDGMVRVHSFRINSTNLLQPTLGRLTGSTPPLSSGRYRNPDDKLVSLNLLNKLNDDSQLRTQASYAYSKASYGYSDIKRYYDTDRQVIIDRSQFSESRDHKPEFTAEYRVNSSLIDLTERLEAKADFFDASLPTWRQNNPVSQDETMKSFDLRNFFSVRWVRGKWNWAVRSDFAYRGGPEGRIDIDFNDDNLFVVQTARTSVFTARHGVEASYSTLKSYLNLPINVTVNDERINTLLLRESVSEAANRIHGSDFRFEAMPSYRYQHPRQLLTFTASANLKAQSYNYQNSGSVPAHRRSTKLTVNPSIYLLWNLNAKSSFSFSSSFNHDIGDILDMLTAPMATDYIGLRAQSGIISENKQLSGSLAYKFQMPVELLFFNASVSHNRVEMNLLSAQSVDEGLIGSYTVDHPAHSESTSLRASFTKQVQPVKTKFSVSGVLNLSRREMFQNDQIIPYHNKSFTISPSVNSAPADFIELFYSVSWSKNFSRFMTEKQSYLVQTHNGRLNFFFARGASIGLSNEMSWHELAPGLTKFISLLDATASYTFKSWRVSAQLNNLLNSRHYAYTIFSGLNNFSYDYRLRGRELILSLTFTK